jgi:hypothetical protein
LAVALLVAGGCRSREARVDAQPKQVASVASKGAPAVDAGGDEKDLCDELRVRFRTLLEQGSGKCTADTDCDCYPAVVDCGGASDRQTVAKLETIGRMYGMAGCEAPGGCTKRRCEVACVQQRCVMSAMAARSSRGSW